ncbi:MAG: helix-turn-helix domain-containing protein [Thermodesulfobacteriota bacterium]
MSDLHDAINEMADGLYNAGGMDKITLRQIKMLCIPSAREYSAEQIKEIRKKTKTSRAVFATLLNVKPSTVEHWERGLKKPSGPSLRLLEVVDRKGIEALC